MIIKKRIKLGTTNYYISCNCEYKEKDGRTYLCLKDYRDDYYDGGDLSRLIDKVEQNYSNSIRNKYGDEISFIADCLYIYDHIPFISGIEDAYISSDNVINSTAYISKEELDEYIKQKNITMKENKDFKLCDERTWNI